MSQPTRFLTYQGQVEDDITIVAPPGWEVWQAVTRDYDFESNSTRVGFARISDIPDAA